MQKLRAVWRLFRRVWLSLVAISTAIGVLLIWDDLQNLPKAVGQPNAYENVWGWLVSFDRETIAFVFLGLALLWILWMDVRPSVRRWWMTRNRPPHFKIDDHVYCESYLIAGTTELQLYANVFYLVVSNKRESGETLKRVQARLFHIGPPTICRVKDTEAGEIDIRHGEVALFEIGRFVSDQIIGLPETKPYERILDASLYKHNIPKGYLSFEVSSVSSNQEYLLMKDNNATWGILLVVSADDVKARKIDLTIDMNDPKQPVCWKPYE